VAQRVKLLEREIGAKLLCRSGRTVSPTEAGTALVERSRSFLRELRNLKAVASDAVLAGELRVGTIPTAVTGLLPSILSCLAKAYPQVKVHVVPGTSGDLYVKVLGEDLDAAIITQPYFAFPKTCNWQVLREEPLIVLASASMPASDPHTLLAREPFIRYSRDQWCGRLVDTYLRQARIRPQERFKLDALDAIAVLVNQGLGVSLVPDWAPPWPEGLVLTRLSLPDQSRVRRIVLLWTRASTRKRLIHALLKQARIALALPGADMAHDDVLTSAHETLNRRETGSCRASAGNSRAAVGGRGA
jgi:DNA-binding transcriptional LysR family regulator